MGEEHTDTLPCNCQSLMGYAEQVHARSGGVCAYCEYGKDEVDFAVWRQLTLEHVIPARKLNYERIRVNIKKIFSLEDADWPRPWQKKGKENLRGLHLSNAVYRECEVTACHFCNSVTSRFPLNSKHSDEFWAVLEEWPEPCDLPNEKRESKLLGMIRGVVKKVFDERCEMVKKKRDWLEKEFNDKVRDRLRQRRDEHPNWNERFWTPFHKAD